MIRKLTRLFAAVTLLFIGGKTFAQTEKDTVYVFLQDMPDAGIYLPPPPDMRPAGQRRFAVGNKRNDKGTSGDPGI